MKQYTTAEQTSKLMELGFEKPKNTRHIQRVKARNLYSPFIEFGEPEFEGSYTIGELIEMLPRRIDDIYPLYITLLNEEWEVYYGLVDDFKWWSTPFDTIIEDELIDALYAMVLRLKEEGVI